MNKAKEILYKHAKSNRCKSDLLINPFLEQAVLNAINEALTIPAVVGRSEQLCQHDRGVTNRICDDCGSVITYVPDELA